MLLTLLNLTTERIVYRLSGNNDFRAHELTLDTKTRASTELPKGAQAVLLRDIQYNESKERLGGGFLHVPLAFSGQWKAVSAPDECPWRIYLRRACCVSLQNDCISN